MAADFGNAWLRKRTLSHASAAKYAAHFVKLFQDIVRREGFGIEHYSDRATNGVSADHAISLHFVNNL